MTRQDCAKKLILNDILDIMNAFFKCREHTRVHFMLGGLLYFATIISGGVDWCEKAGIPTSCFADKETIDKLRAKVKLYSSDNIIPFNEQKRIMEAIVRIEKQYWLALQAKSGKWCPKFIIPDAGAYSASGHYIGNTLEYAYEYSPLNPCRKPILEVLGGTEKESSLAFTFSTQIGETMQELYTKIAGKPCIIQKQEPIELIIDSHDFRIDNRRYFRKDNSIFAFNLCCRINYLLEIFAQVSPPNSLLLFRMMYITFYHLKYDLENLGLDFIYYAMPHRNKDFRNAMAHYSLFGKLSDQEIVENAVGFGLFEKYFGKSFENIRQELVGELIKTRDSLENYVKF